MTNDWARAAFIGGLRSMTGGTVRLQLDGTIQEFGTGPGLSASLNVHDHRFFRRALTAADIGIGESYMDGDWTSTDLVALGRLMLRNRAIVESRSGLQSTMLRWIAAAARRLRNNSLTGSRRNIRRHYDLGNDFFRLFLDANLLMYSSAYFSDPADSLEQAQFQKVERVARLLDLKPGDHVLEIGTGWGGFALWAASTYGCRVTTTTISDRQYEYACAWRERAGDAGRRVEVLRADYRNLTGRFDKIVSIEMFEAVGLDHYDEYFGAADRLLTDDGTMFIQTITVTDQWFPKYHGQPDWIEKHIFPGGELASIGEIAKSLSRATNLSIHAAENFGLHYARTLHEWRRRFLARLDDVRRLGFDDRFIRMWEFYLAICEAAFLERHTGVYQLLLAKNGVARPLFNDAWARTDRELLAG
ncbi:MAG TPA: cyclopropane-fatty-acyl-phospholipid synthase family protein [Vicinamibacterales bacterium]